MEWTFKIKRQDVSCRTTSIDFKVWDCKKLYRDMSQYKTVRSKFYYGLPWKTQMCYIQQIKYSYTLLILYDVNQ
jgi:hypothetical protein